MNFTAHFMKHLLKNHKDQVVNNLSAEEKENILFNLISLYPEEDNEDFDSEIQTYSKSKP